MIETDYRKPDEPLVRAVVEQFEIRRRREEAKAQILPRSGLRLGRPRPTRWRLRAPTSYWSWCSSTTSTVSRRRPPDRRPPPAAPRRSLGCLRPPRRDLRCAHHPRRRLKTRPQFETAMTTTTATTPAAFAIQHIASRKLVPGRRFTTCYAATKASWKMGGDKTGLDHHVVGLDRAGNAYELEVLRPFEGGTNRSGYRLGRPYRAAK